MSQAPTSIELLFEEFDDVLCTQDDDGCRDIAILSVELCIAASDMLDNESRCIVRTAQIMWSCGGVEEIRLDMLTDLGHEKDEYVKSGKADGVEDSRCTLLFACLSTKGVFDTWCIEWCIIWAERIGLASTLAIDVARRRLERIRRRRCAGLR